MKESSFIISCFFVCCDIITSYYSNNNKNTITRYKLVETIYLDMCSSKVVGTSEINEVFGKQVMKIVEGTKNSYLFTFIEKNFNKLVYN